MASERRHLREAAAGAALLALASAGAGVAYPSMAVAGCLAAAGVGAAVLLRAVRRLADAAATPPREVAVGVPLEQRAMLARALELDTRLEHAPVALFGIGAGEGNGAAAPLNAQARRLLAPGRAVDAESLFAAIAGVQAGNRATIEFTSDRGNERALAMASALTVDGRPQRLVAVMPAESELEAEAMQAWQRLVQVVAHEVMNSLTPVASLTQTAREIVASERNALDDDAARDLATALDAIGRRADSLVAFVAGYRTLASVPAARPQAVDVAAMFARIGALVGTAWQARGGRVTFAVDPATVELMADPGQIEQALLNLLANALDATAGMAAPEAAVSARLTRGGRLRIEVRDNGPGIDAAAVPHLFTPFYTTKDKGSGIGLAMVRQLVHRNGGTVRHVRQVGAGACFVIAF